MKETKPYVAVIKIATLDIWFHGDADAMESE